MKILYAYGNCSNIKYRQLFQSTNIMISQQAQKYHSLFIEGLRENGADVTCISGLPINRDLTKKIYIHSENETVNGIKYRYFGTINFSILRRLILFIKAFFFTLFCDRDMVAVCDILNISMVAGVLFAAKLRGIHTLGIVTDIPGYLSTSGNKSLTEKINSAILKKFNAYIFLTEAMNEVINRNDCPYIVLEGHVDLAMKNVENTLSQKTTPKILMYAGSLKKIYGIKMLTQAFLAANAPGWELHIYGDGNFADELKEICRLHSNIKYLGVKLNQEIVEAEISATLLVNPRPTNEEYTKYSFPSKNMEYMVSGTPLLTTKLPGMPKEYEEYVYLIEDESVNGMTKILQELLKKSETSLHDMGQKAKQYVLINKNNVIQAGKLTELIKKLVTNE